MTRVRILFLSDNFPPEVNAPAARTYEHCKRWVSAGAQVTVITCAPNFPQGKVYSGYRNRIRSVETIDGIRVVRIFSYIAANTGFFLRTLDFISFAVFASIAGLFENADVIVATSPQFFTAFSGYFLSMVLRKPWVFELRDLWPESIATVGHMTRKGRLYGLLESMELFLYRRATRVVPVTPAFAENLERRGIDPGKIEVITNGADLSCFVPCPRNDTLRKCLGIAERFVIGYIGTHGLAHGLSFIVESAPDLEASNVHFLLVGDGAEKKTIRRRARALGVRNVSFHEPVPRSEVVDWLAACDAVLVPLAKSETFKTVIPSKIFEAAAMGLPILLGVDGQARSIVEKFDAGLYFEPENRAEFLAAARRISTDCVLRKKLRSGGLALASAYNRDALASTMLKILEKLDCQAQCSA